MQAKMEISGLDSLKNRFRRLAAVIDYDTAQEIVKESADDLQGQVRTAAPLGPTGNLKAGVISKDMPKSRVPVSIVAMDYRIAPHAHLVEYGTSKMAARPFFRPTVDANGLRCCCKMSGRAQDTVREASA